MDGIENAFKRIGIKDFGKKIIAYGADGASKNRDQFNGVIALMREKYPLVYFIWCLAHSLELSLKDAIGETCFKSVDDMILRLYYLYASFHLTRFRGCCRKVVLPRIKPTVRASLGKERLNTVIQICHEGPDLENFDATKAMQLWYLDKVRRPGQKGKRTYTQRKSTKSGKTLAEQ